MAIAQHGCCQNAGSRNPCFNCCYFIQLYIQLDLICAAMCISSSFLSLFCSGQPVWTEFYSLHLGNNSSLYLTLNEIPLAFKEQKALNTKSLICDRTLVHIFKAHKANLAKDLLSLTQDKQSFNSVRQNTPCPLTARFFCTFYLFLSFLKLTLRKD